VLVPLSRLVTLKPLPIQNWISFGRIHLRLSLRGQPWESTQHLLFDAFMVTTSLLPAVMLHFNALVVIVVSVVFHARAVPFQIQRRIMNQGMNVVELELRADGGARVLNMPPISRFKACRAFRQRRGQICVGHVRIEL
jgi:hypothetical protein